MSFRLNTRDDCDDGYWGQPPIDQMHIRQGALEELLRETTAYIIDAVMPSLWGVDLINRPHTEDLRDRIAEAAALAALQSLARNAGNNRNLADALIDAGLAAP